MLNNYAIFVQARMSSSRLPGKVLTEIEGYPMLYRQVDRLMKMSNIPVYVLTSDDISDNPIENLCITYGFNYFRGSLNNVLSRFLEAAILYNITHIIRVGGDDPLIDPEGCEYLKKEHLKYGGNFLYSSHRSGWPYGCACELIEVKSLMGMKKINLDKVYLEHITPWFFDNQSKYDIRKIFAPSIILRPHYYFSVDYYEDMELIRKIFIKLKKKGKYFSLEDVIQLCDKNPNLLNINKALHSGFDE